MPLSEQSGATQPTSESWAVIWRLGNHTLRRGSWHRVVRDDAGTEEVLLDVHGRGVPVSRRCLSLQAARPLAWTVIEEATPNAYLGSRYAVCPHCWHRMPLDGAEHDLQCAKCNLTFPVNWP